MPPTPSNDQKKAEERSLEPVNTMVANKNQSKATDSSTDAVLWITYANIVLYALCYQLQRPVEPFLIQSLTEQEQAEGLLPETSSVNQTYGNLQSFFSFCQMFGSPLVGILLDRIGIRKTSCVVFVASALSYGILASASDLKLLFVSKIPTIFQAAFLVAQATAATATGDNAALRAAALGRMTTAYTIGATIGPALGGYLAARVSFCFDFGFDFILYKERFLFETFLLIFFFIRNIFTKSGRFLHWRKACSVWVHPVGGAVARVPAQPHGYERRQARNLER